MRQTVGMIFQNSDDQLFMPTVEEDIAFGPRNAKLPENEIERRIMITLGAVGYSSLRKCASHHLSGGEKRSIAIASVLAMEPDILVMDEPSSNLDSRSRRLLIEQIKCFTHTCLIATHDLELVYELCERAIVMKKGEIVADGSIKEIFSNKALLYECGLEQPYQMIIENMNEKNK